MLKVRFLYSLKVDAIKKVASADLTDNFLHEFLSKINSKIIISTGMSNMSEIKYFKIYKKTQRCFFTSLCLKLSLFIFIIKYELPR